MARAVREPPSSFQSIPHGERLRWRLGLICIEGEYRPVQGSEGPSSVIVWPSWRAWERVYVRCRTEFLHWAGERHEGWLPGAERIWRALCVEGDAGVRYVLDELATEEAAGDPRRLLQGG